MDESAADAVSRSDAELITAAASGDAAAFSVLRERHTAAVRSLAGLLSPDPAQVQQITADSFTRLHSALREGSGPEVALRPHLFIAVRWAAYQRLPAGQADAAPGAPWERADPASARPGWDADTAQQSQEPEFAAAGLADLVRSPLNRAFLSRPERSRAVLWHLDVEQIGPAETAAILGLTQEGVFEFAGEARAGLRQSYRSQHLAQTPWKDCASALATLSTGADGQLTGASEPAMAEHLHACPDCRATLNDLADLGQSLRRVVAPIYLGTAAPAYLQASIGGLHWTLERTRTTHTAPRSRRRVLAVACGLLAAAAATGLALVLTGTSGSPQDSAAQNRAAAAGTHSRPSASTPLSPGSGPTGSAPAPGPSGTPAPVLLSPSPAPSASSPQPTTSPSPQPTTPLPSPSPTVPPRHHRHRPPSVG